MEGGSPGRIEPSAGLNVRSTSTPAVQLASDECARFGRMATSPLSARFLLVGRPRLTGSSPSFSAARRLRTKKEHFLPKSRSQRYDRVFDPKRVERRGGMDARVETAGAPKRQPGGRLLRRRRILARMREGWAYEEIARAESVTVDRIRKIVAKFLSKRVIDDEFRSRARPARPAGGGPPGGGRGGRGRRHQGDRAVPARARSARPLPGRGGGAARVGRGVPEEAARQAQPGGRGDRRREVREGARKPVSRRRSPTVRSARRTATPRRMRVFF